MPGMNNALVMVLASGGILLVAYFVYGRFLARRVLDLRNENVTPAVALEDGVDFVPTRKPILFGHHFASIAGLAPIVGPAIAIVWGWAPALAWVVGGSIFIGAVHDMSTLVASVRHKAATIGDVTRAVIGPRAQVLFLLVIFFALALAMGVFALLMAKLFTDASPQAVMPTFSLIVIAAIIGLLVYKAKWNLAVVTLMGLVAMFTMVWVGAKVPVPIWRSLVTDPFARQEIEAGGDRLLSGAAAEKHFQKLLAAPKAATGAATQTTAPAAGNLSAAKAAAADVSKAVARSKDYWTYTLLVYAFIASVLPVWLLLQPRDYINSFLLYAGLLAMVVGFLVWRPPVLAPAFNTQATVGAKGDPWLPFLFITIACGAVSGFHNIVSSGTTARQLRRERDAQCVGYGAMLVEGFLAVLVIVACACALPAGAEIYDATNLHPTPPGLGGFLTAAANVISKPIIQWGHVPCAAKQEVVELSRVFIAVVVVSFAMTTLDSGTRLQRYTVEALAKLLPGRGLRRVLTNRYVSSLLAVVTIAFIALLELPDATGKMQRAGNALWILFGTTNQLLASLGLLIVSVYLWVRRKPIYYTLIPMIALLVMVTWAMIHNIRGFYQGYQQYHDSNSLTLMVISAVLLVIAAWICVEAVLAFRRKRPDTPADETDNTEGNQP